MEHEFLNSLFELGLAMGLFYGVCKLVQIIIEAIDDLFL